MNEDNLINVDELKPFPKFCCTIGMLPTVFKVSMTYEEQVLECIRFIKEEIFPKVNQNALATIELQNKFIELVEYVDNYFENLDLTEEVSNKLDEMVENGTLQEMINQIIVNSTDEINVKIAGAKGDGSTNDTQIIQELINQGKPLYFPAGTYLVESLNCNEVNVNIRGAGRNQTTIRAYGNSAITTLIDASSNEYGFNIKDLRIDGKDIVGTAIVAGDRYTGYTSTRRNNIENISIINCTSLGLYVGNVSATVNNINIVGCYAGVHLETYGAILTNSVISQCETYGLKLSNGNGYVTNNKIYLNGEGIICEGLVYSVCNNNIQQNHGNGITLEEFANSNIFNENVLLGNGWYTDITPIGNYEIVLNGFNNRITGNIIPFINNWNSKRVALVKNVDGFNNYVELTQANSLQSNDGLNQITYINGYKYIEGNNISNIIKINEIENDKGTQVSSFASQTTTGEHITQEITGGVQELTLANVTLSKWAQGSLTNLEGGMVRIVPSQTENLNGIYVTFDVENSIQFDKVGIGHYLSYYAGSLIPVSSVANVKATYNPLTNKHKVSLYVLFDAPTNVSYFQINSRFASLGENDVTISSLTSTISNVKYKVF